VLAKLPKIRSHWPKTIVLTQKTYFRIMSGDRVIGMSAIEAGTTLPLVEVCPEHAIVLVQGERSPLPVEQCNLVETLGGEQAVLSLPDDKPTAGQLPPVEAT